MEQISLFETQKIETKNVDIMDLIKNAPYNQEIQAAIIKCCDYVKNHEKIMCSISGGYDSDIMLDLLIRCGAKDKTTFVFFDTGLEYNATKNHIIYLENKYRIKVKKLSTKKAIPTCCKEYGIPFWSKYVSDMISRLQRNNFEWEEDDFDKLYKKYPKCKSALRWWCNNWGENSRFNISYIKGLKEFIQNNPPIIKISAKCCDKAKKEPSHNEELNGYDMICTGVRKGEGGARSTAWKKF